MATNQPGSAGAPSHAPEQGNGLAVAGMVLGILGLLLCWVAVIGWILGLLGVILGGVGWSKANKVGKGKGMAITGVVTGILGIIVGVAFLYLITGAFTDYAKKTKRSEATLQLHFLERHIKTLYLEKSTLPPSSTTALPGPDGGACPGKMPPSSAWDADPAWRELGFQIDEPSLFTYHWTKTSETAGFATAVGDLDCDTTLTTYKLEVNVVAGNVVTTMSGPTPD